MTKAGLGISVVISAYNEKKRIGSTLDTALHYMRSGERSFEVLVVDDGSEDGTADYVETRGEPELRVLRETENAGKGAAVARGVRASRGEIVLVSDADLSAPIEEIARLEAQLERGYDVACGSSGLRDSNIVVRQPFYRELMGKIFNLVIRALRLTHFRDTQCGFKLFRGQAARNIFSHCRVQRFAFDVECLFVAERLEYGTVEVPLVWAHVPESRVSPTADAPQMFLDVVRMRIAAWMGAYDAPASRRMGRSLRDSPGRSVGE